MPLVYGQDQRVADWVGAHSYGEAPPVTAAIGYEVDGELRAGIYFDSILPNTAFAHVASTAAVFPRHLMAAACAYVFRQLKLERLTFLVSGENRKVIEFLRHVGATCEGCLAKAFGAHSGYWYVLWAHDPQPVRFLNWLDSRKGV